MRDRLTTDVTTLAEATEAARSGFARLPWAAIGVEGEAALAAEGVSVRCLVGADGGLATDPDADGVTAYVARAY